MTPDPCSVCGGTDLNLIDGFYYCVECGTQDVNAQETVVEHTMLADGTFARVATRKITKVLKDAIEMSGEWHKWHAFNFILVGLVEELVNLGASDGFRDIVLWIWTRYLKEFMDKDQMGTITEIKEKEGKIQHKSLFELEDDPEESKTNQEENKNEDNYSSDDDMHTKTKSKAQREKDKKKREQDRNSIKIVTKGLLISIMYIALNLDRSDIQLSHLLRFIREGRLNLTNCKKFVPSELDIKSIPHWKNFMNCNKEFYYISKNIRKTAMTLIKVLNLGKPLVPDLRKIAETYVKELCLPNDFKNLVFSLMHQVPCNHLNVNYNFAKKILPRTPDFEGVVMSYVLVALKMTFGLDDHYEISLSETVEKINQDGNRLKSYKLGRYSETTDRLFSFNEWSRYLQFRKILLCKYYLPMAQQNQLDVDDRVFIEHLGERKSRRKMLSDEVTMDILEKIVPTDEGTVTCIPKSEFITTLTPLTDFTELILHYIQDPDVKLLISEDFTQYSLKYACEELKLLNGEENMIKGVSEENKTINKTIVGNLISKENDYSLVFVRNCENQNWLKTNPPTVDHITKIDKIMTDRDSDHGYDSHLEISSTETIYSKTDVVNKNEDIEEFEKIEEEKEGVSIFDDQFNDIEDFNKEEKAESECDGFQFSNDNFISGELESDSGRGINEECNMREVKFNPDTFDRQRITKELVLTACKKYKIPIPSEYDPRGPRKRKSALILDESRELVPIKRKVPVREKRGNVQEEINGIITAYYANIEKELLEKVSEHFHSVVKDFVDLERSEKENRFNNVNNDSDNNIQPYFDDINKIQDDNNDFNKTADSSIMEVEADNESVTYDFMPKVNPDFDEKTHDIKQLYVKYSQGFTCENLIDDDDVDIDIILRKKIEESKFNEAITLCAKDLKLKIEDEKRIQDTQDFSDSEEDETFLQARLLQVRLKLEPLINNPEEIGEFRYWQRHYQSLFVRKNVDRKEKFELELNENFPKSFIFVLKECAAILDCSLFSLYKHLQNLEQSLSPSHTERKRRGTGPGQAAPLHHRPALPATESPRQGSV